MQRGSFSVPRKGRGAINVVLHLMWTDKVQRMMLYSDLKKDLMER